MINDRVTYFELDDVVYLNGSDDIFGLNSSRWYGISEYRKVVGEE